ncbi:MAG: Rrf2 family transcriptional regulator [Candidatus Schekmanbacteria bacterium]|nr:Rrf2 family transcriptional regulator [Candidatus Schekmanbacteria bacterium]
MVISQATECAIRALLYMAAYEPGQVVSKRDICQAQEITPGFLIKIMQPLIAGGLVKSYRGVAGGFALAKPIGEINLWDIIVAEEGPILLNKCLITPGYCKRDATCPVHLVWCKSREVLEKTLRQTKLDDLLVDRVVV